MRTVSLVGTDLRVPRLGFGTSGLHQLVRRRDRQHLLGEAFDLGLRHFDTAPFYGHGIAEQELGRFLQDRRAHISIATKFGIVPHALLARAPALLYAQLAANSLFRRWTGRNRLAIVPRRDYGVSTAKSSLERSLRALRTDHVDIFFLHEPRLALLVAGEDLVSALEGMRSEGKVRYVGLAGAAQDCVEIATRYPGLAQVLQVSAAGGDTDRSLLRAASLPIQFSFGHFRNQTAQAQPLLRRALSYNEAGVILYSSRRPSRIAEMVALLAKMEP